MSSVRQLPLTTALGIWAALGLAAAFYGTWLGFGGRRFAITLGLFVLLLAGQILLAAGNAHARLTPRLGARGAFALAPVPLLAYLIYAVGTNSFAWQRVGLCAAYVLLPVIVLALVPRGKAAGTWQDFLAILLLWLPVELHVLQDQLWPYPDARFGYILTSLLAVNVGIVSFLSLRRVEGVGYTIAWGHGWGWTVGANFLIFAAIAIPLGEAIGFIRFEPSLDRLKTLPLTALGIFLFNAWPEEFLFRGLLQNLLSRTLRSPETGWIITAVIFGLAHINNGPFPNLRYVLLATIAGLFYGRAWMKTGSIFASTLVHMLVNTFWHLLFRTL